MSREHVRRLLAHGPVVNIPEVAAIAIHRAGLVVGWVMVAVLGVGALRGAIPRNPTGGTLTSVELPLQIGLLVVTAVGLALGSRYPAVGAVLVALAGGGLGVLSAVQHEPWVAALVASGFGLSAVALWVAWQRRETLGAVAVLALATSVLMAGSWAGASDVYDEYFGPAHPESTTEALDDPWIDWAWSGGVTDTGFRVVAQPVDDVDRLRMLIEGEGEVVADLSSPVVDGVARFEVDGLRPETRYSYRFSAPDTDSRWVGEVETFPSFGQSAELVLAFASCARTGSNGQVFDTIRELEANLYVQTGDLHYQNIEDDSMEAFAHAYDEVLTAPAQSALYRSTPVAYVWDDHDFGPNDADSSSPSQPAARASYERRVPSYDLVDRRTINQAFSVGDVRVVMIDTRSNRVPGQQLLGADQFDWLIEELTVSATSHRLVILVSPTPWIAEPDPASDSWGGFADERRALADVVAGEGIDNLLFVGGDAHMVAIDDGTNSDYSTSGGAGFPVLQAAALDRRGSVKGGPYSEGTFPGGGQFGVVRISDQLDGTTQVTLEGRTFEGLLVAYTYEVHR